MVIPFLPYALAIHLRNVVCVYQHWRGLYSAAVSCMKMHCLCVKYYLVQECIALLFCDCSLQQPLLHIVGNTALNHFHSKRVRTSSALSLIELDYPTNKIVAEYYCVSFAYFCKDLIKWTRSLWSALHLFAQASGIRFYKCLFFHLPLLHDDRTFY